LNRKVADFVCNYLIYNHLFTKSAGISEFCLVLKIDIEHNHHISTYSDINSIILPSIHSIIVIIFMANEQQLIEKGTAEFGWIDSLSNLMDTKFRIPGTNIRFGGDFIMGLLPGAGDLASFGVSGILILAMARHGVSSIVIARMLGNVFLDTVVGSIPILGNIFDLTYKANTRNVNLLKEHYQEGKHTGSVVPVLIGVVIALIAIFFLLLWIVWKIVAWSFDLLNQINLG